MYYIVNLAAQTSDINSIEDPFYDQMVNILSFLNLLFLSVKYNVKKFIHSFSSAAAGRLEMPMNESKIPNQYLIMGQVNWLVKSIAVLSLTLSV